MPDDAASTLVVVPQRPAPSFSLGRMVLEPRQDMAARQQTFILVGAVVAGLALSAAILLTVGLGPSDLLQTFILDNLFVADNLRSVLTQHGAVDPGRASRRPSPFRVALLESCESRAR